MRIPLTPHGIPELVLFTALFGGAAWAAWEGLPFLVGRGVAVVAGLALLFVFNFFRDPDRAAQGGADAVIAPADGKVTDVLRIERAPFIDGPAMRIGIFLSVFDVHVNRTPLPGTVALVRHRPGRYLDARDPACADENEAVDLGLHVADGAGGRFPVLVRQIAGLIARRIVCKAREGDVLAPGQRYGMIKFGSRTEVWLPVDCVLQILAKPGDRVKGGRDVLARLRAPVPAKTAAGGFP